MKSFLVRLTPILPFLRPNAHLLGLGAFGIILVAVMVLPGPLITRHIIDVVIPARDLGLLGTLVAAVVGILIVTRCIDYAVTLLFARIKARLTLDLRTTLLRRIHGITFGEFRRYSRGYLLSRIDEDTAGIQGLFVDSLIRILSDITTFIVIVVVLFYLNWMLALCILALLPLFLLFTIYYSRQIKKGSQTYYEKRARSISRLEESLSLVTLSNVFLKMDFNVSRFRSRAEETFNAVVDLARSYARYTASSSTTLGLLPIVTIGVGGLLLIDGHFTLGSLVAFMSFSANMFEPARRLVNMNVEIQQALVSLNRFNEIYQLPAQQEGHQEVVAIEAVEFKDVSFAYPDAPEDNVINGVDLPLLQPMTLGIVGGSGSGKSTVLKMLLRLFDAGSGTIAINGRDIRDYRLESLRGAMALVEQEPLLMRATVFDNICFGLRPEMMAAMDQQQREAAVAEVAGLARLDFVNQLPEAFNYKVGDEGAALSIGQKQRIALARALIRKPGLLLLDEATANLDSVSEAAVLETVRELSGRMMIIIVSHRLGFIQSCDNIVVMENGRIVEHGDREELANRTDSAFRRYLENYNA